MLRSEWRDEQKQILMSFYIFNFSLQSLLVLDVRIQEVKKKLFIA